MNIRKPTDYVTMFTTLDTLMAAQLPQMELYCEIGRVVSGRVEKGAAVAASEYLQAAYPTAEGFSPRNLRRMRAFYAAYEESPEIMRLAMNLGWTRNVAILETLKVINSPDKFDASGTMVLVPPISTPRYLLAFYNAMLRHEDDVDAVIICGIESCEAASTVQYCTPPGKFFSLNGGLDEEELLSELRLILDSLFAEGNQLNV